MQAILRYSLAALLFSAGGTASAQQLPRPTGRYAVGMSRFQWTDSTRAEIEPGAEAARRSLVVRVFYPAIGTIAPSTTPYVPQLDRYAAESLIVRTRELVRRMRHYATLDAPVAAANARFPVIVFSAGNGEMEYMYTALLSDLASHGYVVASVSHPGVANVVFPDGHLARRHPRLYDPKPAGWDAGFGRGATVTLRRAVNDTLYAEAADYLEADVSFVLDRLARLNAERGTLAGRIDLGRIATLGHSYGGNIAVEACARDRRVDACMTLDGGSFGPVRDVGLAKPYMVLRPAFVNDSTPRGLAQDHLLGTMRADGYDVAIGAGAQHRSFMDAFFIDTGTTPEAKTAARVHTIIGAYMTAFLARYLDGTPAPLLERLSPQFPEVSMRAVRLLLPAGADYRHERAKALRACCS